ncbi:MAG: DNA-formamidopyrimidine glycosylase family protein [Gordonia sp. (in: high G+C Gram-positive bacteria)]|uniref:DNA-formamidopyrimidine glycosylase family protein n=1 Tax=Gordonia sp. (in: high G+C Gram-positive bacteria) TaxID=84139 RepID=UPI0039E4B2D0
MPEGDTVYRAAHRLDAALTGATLTRSDFRIPSLATVDLSGARVTACRSVGKHLFIDLDGDRTVSIHSHLKMEGAWHVYRPGERWRRPGFTARIVLRTGQVEAVGFDLGTLELTERPGDTVAHLGPDLLGPDWDLETAAANLAADPDRPIGLALLDQRAMAGVGNIYRSELCFLSAVHPATPIGAVDALTLAGDAHRLLAANRLQAVRCTTGDRRRGRELWVYGRDRRACRRCGTAIRRGMLSERVIYFCPSCQRPPAAST